MDAFVVFCRSMLFFLNLASTLGSFPMIVIGIICKINMNGILDRLGVASIAQVPVWLIVLGICLFLVSFLVCCGILRGSILLLLIYVILLLIIIILQIGLAAYAYVKMSESSVLKDHLHAAMKDIFTNPDLFFTEETIHYIQNRLKCCGLYTPPYKNFPSSCCESYNEENKCIPYKEGCWHIVHGMVTNCLNIMGTLSACLVVVELTSVSMAIYVILKIRDATLNDY